MGFFSLTIAVRFGWTVQIPPSARISGQCYTAWNADKSDLQVVWQGTIYDHPFDQHFSIQPGLFPGWEQGQEIYRLWCTDSGAVGWYGGESSNRNSTLRATWLGHDDTTFTKELDVSGEKVVLSWFPKDQPYGTISVVGNALYFFSYYSMGVKVQELPRLSSLIFDQWSEGKTGTQLVSMGLSAYNVMGSHGLYQEMYDYSPIYPSGPSSITVGVQPETYSTWAVDAVVDTMVPKTRVAVYYETIECPSIISNGREIVTFPDYTCRSFTNGSTQCASITNGGSYAWMMPESHFDGLRDMKFTLLTNKFALPSNLWLMPTIASPGRHRVYMALVGPGYAPVLGVVGDDLVAIITQPDSTCASGYRLHLVRLALQGLTEITSEPLHCEWLQISERFEGNTTVYSALSVKWAGPWTDGQLFTAVSIQNHEYHERGTPETKWVGDPSREHVAKYWDIFARTVHLKDSLMVCMADGEPSDETLVRTAIESGDIQCIDSLIPERMGPHDRINDCPLIIYVRNTSTIPALQAKDVSVNQKCVNMTTPLNVIVNRLYEEKWPENVREHPLLTALLDAGAAICTWPVTTHITQIDRMPVNNAFDLLFNRYPDNETEYHKWAMWKQLHKSVHIAPCEPGWWLGKGKACEGLTMCGPGYYCPGWHELTNKRNPCPSGTYGPLTMAISVSQCRPCPIERPFSAPGSSDISDCMTPPSATRKARKWKTTGNRAS